MSVSGYYSWLRRPVCRRKKEETRLELEIKAAHCRTRQSYGPERLHRELLDNGVVIGIYRIKRIRRQLGLRCRQRRKFKATTNSRHSLPVAPNLLNQNFEATAPLQAWLGDITHIPTAQGWLYLAGLKDLFTKEIVGYCMGPRMTKELVCNCLGRAIAAKGIPRKGLIHHCDRGSQYCSHEFRAWLNRYGIKESMSRKGNCYDNAPIESFWGILKTELVYQCRFVTRQEAMRIISEYIEIFYNQQRKQAGSGV